MKNRYFLIAILSLIALSMACAIPLESSPSTTSTVDSPVPTVPPTSINPPAKPSPTSLPEAVENSDLVDLYQQANPGVVTIWTFASLGAPHDDTLPTGQGSGFVIDDEGHILTNQHVIVEADNIEVDFPSGYRAWATVVGTDPDSDLALLKVEAPLGVLHPLPLGDSDKISVGERVVAIGNPFGLSGTMTVGIISAVGRTLESERAAPTGGAFSAGAIIQTDAAINPGNSGGPLLNMRGQVIGVNRAIRTESFTVTGSAANSGVGFAVPINIVRRVVPSLISKGFYEYPYLGISSLSENLLNLQLLEDLGLPADIRGAYVTCVTPDGPAEKAGLVGAGPCNDPSLTTGGDFILAIDGNRIKEFGELLSYLISSTEPGQEIILTVYRNEEEVDIPVTIGARP
jgi:2-alkenal reductase